MPSNGCWAKCRLGHYSWRKLCRGRAAEQNDAWVMAAEQSVTMAVEQNDAWVMATERNDPWVMAAEQKDACVMAAERNDPWVIAAE